MHSYWKVVAAEERTQNTVRRLMSLRCTGFFKLVSASDAHLGIRPFAFVVVFSQFHFFLKEIVTLLLK